MNKMKPYYWASLVFYAFIVLNILIDVLLVQFIIPSGHSNSMSNLFKYVAVIYVILTMIFIGILKFLLLKRAPVSRPASAYFWRLLMISILSAVLCAPISVYGLAVYIMGGNKTDSYLVFGLVLLLMVYYFPRYGQWEKYIRSKTAIE